MPRPRHFLFLSLAAVVVGLVVAWVVWPRTAITRDNAAKIELRMTLAEVEQLLGGPTRCEYRYRGHSVSAEWEPVRLGTVDAPRHPSDLTWCTDFVQVVVDLDDGGQVMSVFARPLRPDGPPYLLEPLYRWLGW